MFRFRSRGFYVTEDSQAPARYSEDSKTPAKRVRTERRCSCYSEVRHNSCTCKVEIEDVDNSNTSE
jgi:hypothetical protein